MTDAIDIVRIPGPELPRYLGEVARLRIEVFRDFPYLYDGDLGYEEEYLQTYVRSPRAVIVLACAGDRIVGASTAIPLADESEEFQRPFLAHGYELEEVFYCGESVLQRDYRGRGIGVRFFEEREAHARALGGFRWSSFCAVERPENHPLRPADYVPLDAFWTKRGYTRHPELWTTFRWKDIDQPEQTDKKMVFWLKRLEPAG
ncbi:MAG TPA: GNAT family N-acetyltransferase [Burkholderiales bacterium]